MDDYTDSFLTSKGEELKDKIIDKSGDFLKSIYDVADEPANIVGPNLSLNIAEALGLTQEPDPDKDPIVINVNDIMGQAGDYMGQAGDYLYNLNPDGADVVSGIFNAFGGMANEKIRNTLGPYINYFSDNPEYDYDINFADGGRVGMQQGGMPAPALLGVSSGSLGFGGGQQNMANFQDAMYRPPLNRPPMRGDPDFVSGPGFGMQPTPMPFPVGPFKPMPFQPSPMQTADFDFGDYLGGSDPFAADYDPYVNATGTGAYDQYGMGMTQEDIDKVFADVDKFSLAAQEAKRKAEEEAAAAAQQQQMGGDGPGPGGNTTGSFQGNYGQGPGATVGGANQGGYGDGTGGACFEPNTLIEMEDGSEKKIKDVQLGDFTKGGKVTGVLQFEPIDDIHEYKGVIVAGSHFVREGNEFIMVQDSPKSVKIDKIPVVYSLDTTNRRIFINNIEFADYNGDGIAKKFLNNAGMDLAGFDKEVLRQVEHRLI